MNREMKLFITVGPSCSGKSTLISELEKRGVVRFIPSYTTRTIREGESEGKPYYFITGDEFVSMINNDEFIEWTENHGNLYGKRKSSFKAKDLNVNVVDIDSLQQPDNTLSGSELREQVTSSNFDIISAVDIDSKGLYNYFAEFGRENVFVLYVTANEETLRTRMLNRDGEISELRMKNGELEHRYFISHGSAFDGYIDTSKLTINEVVERALELMKMKK